MQLDTELDAEALRELVDEFKALIKMRKGVLFPEDPQEQLWGAIGAVFGSWMNDRAIVYRKLNDIPESWGTAVNVQSMVFGNMGDDSGTGVAFTRDPASGENVFYGEFLMNAQGEDVVAGIRTPLPIRELERENPQVYGQLLKVRRTLEQHYRDVHGHRVHHPAGHALHAAVPGREAHGHGRGAHRRRDGGRAAHHAEAGAVARRAPTPQRAAAPGVRPGAKTQARARRTAARQGAQRRSRRRHRRHRLPRRGRARHSRAMASASSWCAIETSPEDIRGMAAAEGILTARGGMTSHAALVGRQMGKVCVVGCEALEIDDEAGTMRIAGRDDVLRQGDALSLDGFTGEVFRGEIPTRPSEVIEVLIDSARSIPKQAPSYRLYARLMDWADKVRRLGVRANADLPEQCAQAIAFGAEGVGLCRTEHMFFGEGKIGPMREMILAADAGGAARRARQAAAAPARGLRAASSRRMDGSPVTIRTIDPPLHEFLPHDAEGQRGAGRGHGHSGGARAARVEALHEFNPMLGFRGCRLGIVFPEITEMQARAIFEAAARGEGSRHRTSQPEVMIPLVGHVKEFAAPGRHRASRGRRGDDGARHHASPISSAP